MLVRRPVLSSRRHEGRPCVTQTAETSVPEVLGLGQCLTKATVLSGNGPSTKRRLASGATGSLDPHPAPTKMKSTSERAQYEKNRSRRTEERRKKFSASGADAILGLAFLQRVQGARPDPARSRQSSGQMLPVVRAAGSPSDNLGTGGCAPGSICGRARLERGAGGHGVFHTWRHHHLPSLPKPASDPNFRQSTDWNKKCSHGNGRSKIVSQAVFCLSEVGVFSKCQKKTRIVSKKCPTSQKLRFRLPRTWGFASENLSLVTFPSSTCSLLSSAFEPHPVPPNFTSERAKANAFPDSRATLRSARSDHPGPATEIVNNRAHSLVVLVLCVFGTCRAFRVPAGFYMFTKSYDSMEFSGEDDQSNSAGAHPTGSDLQQQQEWWNQTPLPDDQMPEPDWWNQTHVSSHHFGEQERSGRRPAPADSTQASGQTVQPSPPMPMQLMNVPCHAEVHTESNVPDHLWDWWNDDPQRQWLQVQPWNSADPLNKYGIMASRTGHQQDHNWINGIVGMPMTGIDGHLGLIVAMMMGGHRGHSGMVNRRSILTRVRLQNGTEIILRKPGATIVAH